jgi:arylsulfatase A-like enzyme
MAWTGGGQLDPVFGLDQGFESYAMPPGSQDFDTVVQPALEWLDRNRDARAFLFLHTYEVHHPYPEPDPALSPEVAAYQGPLQGGIQVGLLQDINRGRLQVDDQDRRRIVLAYDTGIRQMDQAFAALVDGLRRLGLYDRSLIVVTSDHGEELGEHGKMGWHSHTLYDELLLVPLLVKLPRGAHAGLEVKAPVRSIDIAPTILDALAIAAPDDFEGTSLLAWLDRPSRAGLPAIAKQDYPAPRVIEAYRARPWKLYDERLFQLDRDPGERVNLTGQEPDRVRELAQALSDFVAQREPPPAGEVTVGADTEEQLRALGYVQ